MKDLSKYSSMLLGFMFVFHISAGLEMYKRDMDKTYSYAKDAAEFIIDNNLQQSLIVGHDAWSAMAILPYLPDSIKLYDPKCGRFYRHYLYDTCFTGNAPFKVSNSVMHPKNTFPNRLEDMIFVVNYSILLENVPYMEALFISPEKAMYDKETINIYRFKRKGVPGSIIP
jgi:hypothetical protein